MSVSPDILRIFADEHSIVVGGGEITREGPDSQPNLEHLLQTIGQVATRVNKRVAHLDRTSTTQLLLFGDICKSIDITAVLTGNSYAFGCASYF